MTTHLQLLDPAGREMDRERAVDFGTVTSGATSDPRPLKVRNAGDATVYFARVRALPHPTGQVGAAAHTYQATEFALAERGAYARELELGTLGPGEERALWVRWAVPPEAPPGAAAWAIEVLGAVTGA